MKRLGNVLFLLGFGVMFAACAATDPLSGDGVAEETQEPIIGGTETTGDPAVAALIGRKPGETSGGLCTATLVKPRWLMTAAHCVDPAVAGEGLEYEVRFAPNARQAPADRIVKVKRVMWNRDFNSQNLPAGHDIALVELVADAPAGITPLPFLRGPLSSSMQGSTVRLVGYGLDNGFDQEGTSAGIKRQVNVTLNTIGDQTMAVGTFGSTACNGDSGGPAFATIDGKETMIGVTSYGFIFCIGAVNYTRIDQNLTWVAANLPEGPEPCVPSCTGKQCGSNGCDGSCGDCASGESCQGNQCVPDAGGCPDEDEPNDDAAHPGSLCAGDTVDGAISSATDQDWFVFDVPRSTTYTIAVDNVGAEYAFTLYKKSATTGNLVKVDDARVAGGLLVLSKRTSDGGKYYVQVRGVNGHHDEQRYSLYYVK